MQATGFCSSPCLLVVGEQAHQPAKACNAWGDPPAAPGKSESGGIARGSSSAQGCPPTLTHPKLSPGLLAVFPGSDAARGWSELLLLLAAAEQAGWRNGVRGAARRWVLQLAHANKHTFFLFVNHLFQ